MQATYHGHLVELQIRPEDRSVCLKICCSKRRGRDCLCDCSHTNNAEYLHTAENNRNINKKEDVLLPNNHSDPMLKSNVK